MPSRLYRKRAFKPRKFAKVPKIVKKSPWTKSKAVKNATAEARTSISTRKNEQMKTLLTTLVNAAKVVSPKVEE